MEVGLPHGTIGPCLNFGLESENLVENNIILGPEKVRVMDSSNIQTGNKNSSNLPVRSESPLNRVSSQFFVSQGIKGNFTQTQITGDKSVRPDESLAILKENSAVIRAGHSHCGYQNSRLSCYLFPSGKRIGGVRSVRGADSKKNLGQNNSKRRIEQERWSSFAVDMISEEDINIFNRDFRNRSGLLKQIKGMRMKKSEKHGNSAS